MDLRSYFPAVCNQPAKPHQHVGIIHLKPKQSLLAARTAEIHGDDKPRVKNRSYRSPRWARKIPRIVLLLL